MEKVQFKNVIIGFGKAGKTIAKTMAKKGESVAVIEASTKMYGGTCINIGCIPSKSIVVNGQKGMAFEDAAEKKATLVGKLNSKNFHMIADEETATVVDGFAKFVSDHEIEITANGEVIGVIEGERIFINTGAKAVLPPIAGLAESSKVITSTELLDLKVRPDHLVIIGSGYIGTEFASTFAKYGAKVTVLDIFDK